MRKAISKSLRAAVAQRAKHVCEYCLIAEEDTFFGCEVDHIISIKHGGDNDPINLAYACMTCNRAKGSDIASLNQEGEVFPLYHPRTNSWRQHFMLDENQILPLSEVGFVTLTLLRFNQIERLVERNTLSKIGHYLSEDAIAYLIGEG